MRHGQKTKKLGRTKEHRLALLRNLARSLFTHGQIRTTLAKAKAAQQFVERLINYAKKNTLATRRLLFAQLNSHEMVKMVVEKIAPLFASRDGGFTHTYLLGPRLGDGAEMAILGFVERPIVETKERKKEEKKEKKKEEKKPKKKEEKKEEKKKVEKPKKEERKREKPKKKTGEEKKA